MAFLARCLDHISIGFIIGSVGSHAFVAASQIEKLVLEMIGTMSTKKTKVCKAK